MDEAARIENELRRRENRHRELRDIAEEATQELASLDGVGGFFARLMGSADSRRADLEATIATANERAEDLQGEIDDLRGDLVALRRARAQAQPEAQRRPQAVQRPVVSAPVAASPDPVVQRAPARASNDAVALRTAKQAAQRLRAAIAVAVDENQDEAVRRARNGRKPMFGERMSLLEMASDQLGVLKEVRGLQRRGADSGVATALQDLRSALDRAGVSGWQSENTPGLTGPMHLLNEALILTGATYDRSRFDVAESVEKLHELSGQVALLEIHLDQRLQEAQACDRS